MRKIIAINGSPRLRNSVSGIIIDKLKEKITDPISVYQALELLKRDDNMDALRDILKADIILLVFPLYVDCLPAPMIKLLNLLETISEAEKMNKPQVFAVVNCGFFEAEHNRMALKIVENFCQKTQLYWNYGLGIGCGGIIGSQTDLSKEPTKAINVAINEFAEAIDKEVKGKENGFVSTDMSQFLYRLNGNLGWQIAATKYKTNFKLKARPYKQ